MPQENFTIKLGKNELEVKAYFQPEEKATREYPGCHSYLEIEEILFEGVDILDLMDEMSQLDYIEEECFKSKQP